MPSSDYSALGEKEGVQVYQQAIDKKGSFEL